MVEIPTDSFYLGRLQDGADAGGALAYDPSDLTTHGVIVGMTGSGKTGLGITLLEEALLQGIPCLIIDPKGDMGNLCLTFPDLSAASFRPWIDESEAIRSDRDPEEVATETAARWRAGLADAGIEPGRIRALRDNADCTIYTPGSESGVPVNLIGTMRAPESLDGAAIEEARDEIDGFVSSLLAMIGVDADPLSSPEHILLANLIEHNWRKGKDVDLATLLGQIQKPPIRKLGVLELDSFYPPKDRTALVLKLNGLLASPSFAAWNQGVPLDIDELLFRDGKPRAAILSLAHLSDAERQFVVTLVLGKMVTWTRRQQGTSSLRALIYMDEVFGYVPPTANPPAKKPILTLLKQARAQGVGLVLSTQNPVDIDYKALSNAGTWMIGRLQTERDKARLLDGMTSSSGAVDIDALDTTISDLDKRQFVLHTTRGDGPRLFSTRWAMSYLAGPMTREQIEMLTDATGRPELASAAGSNEAPAADAGEPELRDDETALAPEVADGTDVHHLDPSAPWFEQVGGDEDGLARRAALIARVQLLFDETSANLRETVEWEAVATTVERSIDWGDAHVLDYDDRDLLGEAPESVIYEIPDAPVHTKTFFREATSALKNHLYREERLQLFRNRELKLYSRVGETEADFMARCKAEAEDRSDAEAAALRAKIEAKRDRVELAIAKHEDRLEELEADKKSKRNRDLLSVGASVLGGLLGGRRRTSTLVRSVGRAASGSASSDQRMKTIENRIDEENLKLSDLEDDLIEALAQIDQEWTDKGTAVEPFEVPLEKADISVEEVSLLWIPVRRRDG